MESIGETLLNARDDRLYQGKGDPVIRYSGASTEDQRKVEGARGGDLPGIPKAIQTFIKNRVASAVLISRLWSNLREELQFLKGKGAARDAHFSALGLTNCEETAPTPLGGNVIE